MAGRIRLLSYDEALIVPQKWGMKLSARRGKGDMLEAKRDIRQKAASSIKAYRRAAAARLCGAATTAHAMLAQNKREAMPIEALLP